MYHIRSKINPEQRHRTAISRAWLSLFLCTAAGATALACAVITPLSPTGGRLGDSSAAIALWEQEPAPPPQVHQHPIQLPPLPPPDIPFPAIQTSHPIPLEHPVTDFPLLAHQEPPDLLLPPPETLGSRPHPQKKTPHTTSPQQAVATTPPAYRDTPEPPYPPALRAERTEGCVRVRIAIDAAGSPTRVDILQSSGHREFDTTARDWILHHWHFFPASSAGKPIASIVSTNIQFIIR